jgi:hypothetical protein
MSQTNQNLSALLRLNDALYEPLSDLSIVSSHNITRQYSTQQSYDENDTIQINMQVSDYVHPNESYLQFKFTPEATYTAPGTEKPTCVFDGSTAVALIKKATLDKGQNIETAEELNLLSYHMNKWKKSAGEDGHFLKIMTGGYQTDDDIRGKEVTVCIPLSEIFGFFDTGVLIPPMALSGAVMKLEIDLAKVAFKWAKNGVTSIDSTSVTVKDVQLFLSEYRLDESAEQKLLSLARSSSGLTYKYTARTHNSIYMPKTTSVSQQVSPPLSNILHSIASVRDEENISSSATEVNSFASKDAPEDNKFRWNYKIGSRQYPQQDVVTRSQSYMQAVRALVKDGEEDRLAVSPNRFNLNASGGYMLLSHNYNRSNVGAMSGVNINNNLQQYFFLADDDNADDLRVDVFTTHVRAIQLFSNGKIVVSD